MRFSTEAKVGLFALLAVGVLFYMTFQVGGFGFLQIKKGKQIIAHFDSVAGLDLKSSVRTAGVEIGKVEQIELERGLARVTIRLYEGVPLRKDSAAFVRSLGLLGEKYIEITPGSPDQSLLEEGGVVQKGQSGADLDQFLSQFNLIADDIKATMQSLRNVLGTAEGERTLKETVENIREISGNLKGVVAENRESLSRTISNLESITGKLQRGEGTLGRLVNDKTLYDEARRAVSNLTAISEKIRKGEGTLGKLTTDEALYTQVKETVENLSVISERLRKGEGTIGKLLYDEGLYAGAVKTLANLTEISEKVKQGEGTVGKLVNEDGLYKDARETLANLNRITQKIENSEGTVGKLLNDGSLANEATKTLKSVRRGAEGIEELTPVTILGTLLGFVIR
ncbi:MAG: MCE family protein [Candidatus Tectomicrobia bacterium]|nr:MCE family protein [Candidatus Tectomicrobia bacterium]